jgi:spore coat protein U domain-containing protein, fimbrial subunit CupE1/2/3/6
MRNFIACLSAGALLATAGAAQAANPATTTFGVSATVLKNCTVAATNVAFGNYTPTVSPVSANGTVSVSCTKNTTFTVSLNQGTTAGGTVAQRLMTDGAGDTLQYNIYTTSGFATVWGDGTGTSVTQGAAGTGMSTPVLFTTFGQLPDSAANQAVPPGTYTDTVTVSVAY